MKVTMTLNTLGFEDGVRASISKVGSGSRKALVEALETISEWSLEQVPVQTGALMNSEYWTISGDYKNGWSGEIGYASHDEVNPLSGRYVSEYAVHVHENVKAVHPIGKPKFLEDPIRAYAMMRFPRTIIKHVNEALL